MNADEYLNRLERQLKGFSSAERQELLDEIASHIQSGAEDPHMGDEPEREGRVMAEMGAPEQMGRGLRGLYRPNRWVDLLWLLAPYYIVFRAANALVNLILGTTAYTDPHQTVYIRVALALSVIFLLVGWRRRSNPLLIFWITSTIGILASLMTRENRWTPGNELIPGSTWQGLVFYAGLAILVIWLVRTLGQAHFDPMLVIYALLPLSLTAANYMTAQLLMQLDSFHEYGIYPTLFLVTVNLAWLGGTALFFLVRQRDLRWFSLLLIASSYAIPNLANYSFFWQVTLMFGGMIALVFIGWALDLRNRGADHRLPG
jgi:hypothetical protein